MKILAILLVLSSSAFAQFDQSHSKFTNILQKFTIKKGHQTLVNYSQLKKDTKELKSYLSDLESLNKSDFKSFTSDQKLAFWINAYNAYTLKVVVDSYPVKTIRDIGGSFFSRGPWGDEFIPLFGKKMSLDDIEHKTIRKKFSEPRIHFAVNCASIGCPSLFQVAFTGEKLEEQLTSATLNFMTNKSKNYSKKGNLYLSKIFKWYGSDFEKKHKSHKDFALKFIKASKYADVEWNEYDWNLNEYK